MKWFFNTTATLILIWCLLSGKFDTLHFGVGVVGALFIAASFYNVRSQNSFPLLRFLVFVPWQLWQILLSNLRVAKLALGPLSNINPTFVRANPEMTDPRALTLLGCAITLTPGTLTVDIDEQEMLIHSLDLASAEDVRSGGTTKKVKQVFNMEP